jgi:hypothetical protein
MNKQTCECHCHIPEGQEHNCDCFIEHPDGKCDCVPSQEEEQDWENKIRSDYKGLLLDQYE